MVTSIVIDKDRAWVVARRSARYVLDRVNLGGITPIVSQRIIQGIRTNQIYLELEDLTDEDRERFGRQVARVADSLEQARPESLSTPGIHGDLLANIRELQRLVEASVAEKGKIAI